MDRTPISPPTPQILPPPLPVQISVLRQLGIADNEWPHGLARLKHNLLCFPSHKPSQESNICANSHLKGPREPTLNQELIYFWIRLKLTVAEIPSDPNYCETFRSQSYLDQIALVCLATGWHDCQAPDCLQYREKLEKVVPVCHSWPGLRKWVLCITTCSLRTIRDINRSRTKVTPRIENEESKVEQLPIEPEEVEESDDGLCWYYEDQLLSCFRTHLTACIALTWDPEAVPSDDWDIGGRAKEADKLLETGDEGGSIGGPRSEPPEGRDAIKPRPPTVPSRPSIYTQTFDPIGPPINVAEVFHLVSWFRNISRDDIGGGPVNAPFWYDHNFIPIASNAIDEASRKIVELGLCQKRVWEVVRYSHDRELALVPFVSALKQLPQLRHNDHESCTSGFCGHATENFTSVTQLHKCLDPKRCVATADEMFNQSHLVEALKGNTMTTAWKLDGMSLVSQDKSYLAISHVWSDGTGVGAWKPGQVNKCLWDFWVKIARDDRCRCDGVWWDTVCIPQDKMARSKALNNMHHNYTVAKCTVVHDLYLAGIEWKNDGSPCIALVLSPWFTRGWTALELLLSDRVLVLFRKGDGYTLKDLDKEILAQHRFLQSHPHWIATEAVKRLRHTSKYFTRSETTMSVSDLLSVLRARYTSWSRDQSIIAGLMCGLTDHAALSEQEITKQVLLKCGKINRNCLLHGLPTMPEPQWSWCPPRFIDIPLAMSEREFAWSPSFQDIPTVSGGTSYLPKASVSVNRDGTLFGEWEIWYIPSGIHVNTRVIPVRPSSADMYVRTQVQCALQNPEQCVILTCKSFDSQGLLVRLKAQKEADKLSREKGPLFCKYIGAVDISPSAIRQHRRRIMKKVYIGYKPGMIDVGVVDWAPEIESRPPGTYVLHPAERKHKNLGR